ncbi:hypothetical protein GCM10007425_18010 [Lysinibacillus alkalisoli]|uniref:Uncharacterized protein n=1 Tax=Lysinibacillus alkalisoli TaxID=1911548 RepID=A0A917G686_9BACI|nr:hypothetical protein GCM10007425_18010 [Lysinibacillus alkalisoli]
MGHSPFCEFDLSYVLEKYPTIESIDLEKLLGSFKITFDSYENSSFESP